MARKSMTKLNAEQTAKTQRRGRADRAAAQPTVTIQILPTSRSSCIVQAMLRWQDGQHEVVAALHAQVHQMIADFYAAAAGVEDAPIGRVTYEGLALAGGFDLQATIRFDSRNGSASEAVVIDEILHDVVPAPL
jgi:hypothetical protein